MKTLNTQELMKGTDGLLFVEYEGVNVPLLEIENFSVSMNFNAVDKQYVGNPVVQSVPTGVAFNLTFTESVVRDEPIINVILDHLKRGKFPVFKFQGKLEKPDGQEQRYAFNNAVPNGNFGLMNVTPGEIVSREQNYTLNEIPDIISSIASTYL
jgi:hypothetical protein